MKNIEIKNIKKIKDVKNIFNNLYIKSPPIKIKWIKKN